LLIYIRNLKNKPVYTTNLIGHTLQKHNIKHFILTRGNIIAKYGLNILGIIVQLFPRGVKQLLAFVMV